MNSSNFLLKQVFHWWKNHPGWMVLGTTKYCRKRRLFQDELTNFWKLYVSASVSSNFEQHCCRAQLNHHISNANQFCNPSFQKMIYFSWSNTFFINQSLNDSFEVCQIYFFATSTLNMLNKGIIWCYDWIFEYVRSVEITNFLIKIRPKKIPLWNVHVSIEFSSSLWLSY